MQFWPSRLKYYLQQREQKFSFNWSTCVLITVFDWFCSYAWNKETPNIWIKKSFGSFNLVMSSWRGWPTTTGWNHNKRSNTYASKKIVRELILEKKTKTTSTLVTTFFKPLSSDRQATEAASRGVLWEKVFLEISQNSQENTCVRVSFLIKLQAKTCNFTKKETLAQMFFCKFSDISKKTLFTEHLRATASVCL